MIFPLVSLESVDGDIPKIFFRNKHLATEEDASFGLEKGNDLNQISGVNSLLVSGRVYNFLCLKEGFFSEIAG